jgi:hypothetical protein
MLHEAQLWMAVRYVALNPVEAGLCDRPEQWSWSSHASMLGGRAPGWLGVERLLTFFEGLGGEPRERYEQLLERR